jgi:glycosylphosphatidylinositol phospholipase D
VGAYGSDVRGDYSGASYVGFRESYRVRRRHPLSSLNGHNGFQINGEQAEDYAGSSVHGVGDVNGDGVDDLVIGAPGASLHGTSSGASYVVYGQADPNVPVTNSVVIQEPDGDMVTITLDGNWLTPRDIKLLPTAASNRST